MIGLLNSCNGFVSATALLQVAGSASMFGWLLLLPSAEFPGHQEPATVAVLAETVPQEEAGPIGVPLVCAPQCNPSTGGSLPLVSPENAAQLQEMMALRARVGTGLGSAEEFQVALAALIQEESQVTRSTSPATSPATLPNIAPSMSIQPTHPPTCAPDAVQLNSCVDRPLEGPTVAAAPIWVQKQYENLVQQWMPPQGQPPQGQPPHGQPQQGQPLYSQPSHGQPQYGQPQYAQPPHAQPQYVQRPHAASQMTVPNIVSNQFLIPQNAPLQFLPGQEFGSAHPNGLRFLPGQWQELHHEHAAGLSISPGTFQRTQHIHFQDPHPHFAPAPEQSLENRGPSARDNSNHRPDNHFPDNHRPDSGPVPNSRPDAHPEQAHRIRHAARVLEEAAWELEEAGEYSLADDVRRQAGELYRRARGQGHDLLR